MKSKNFILFLIILAAVITAGIYLFSKNTTPISHSITVQDKQITSNAKPFVIKINYPYIPSLDGFNKETLDTINKTVSGFKRDSLANDEAVKKIDPVSYAKYPREYDLNISYDKGEIDGNMVSIMLNVYDFTGGAHGESYFIPLNYNPKTKKDIGLADLFPNQTDYIQKISAYCTADLTKQLTKALGSLDGTYLKDGAGPNADNFQFFLINKNNITFYFPRYQVAYGTAGYFKVTMPR